MTINNLDANGLPDAAAIEKLANQFFTAVPGNFSGHGFSPQQIGQVPLQNIVLNREQAVNPDLVPSSLPDPYAIMGDQVPGSVAGIGISPSALQQGDMDDVSLFQTGSSEANFPGIEGVPGSFPGIGTSPAALPLSIGGGSYVSYLEQQHVPQSLSPDVPLQDDNSSVISRSLHHLPYETEQPFEAELREALKAVNLSGPAQHLTGPGISAVQGAPFYFLSENSFVHLKKEAQILSNDKIKQNEKTHGVSQLPFDVNLVRRDFPILQERVNGRPLIWLDNAATTQKPKQVIDRITYFYEHENSNIHRAAHELAARATDAYEAARQKVQGFLNAASPNEIVFVRGATEAINLVAKSWGAQHLTAGDEIIISHLEHHANIVPWKQLADKKGLKIKVIPVDDNGQLLLDEYAKLLGPKTKLVSFTQVSNALGTVTPAKQIIEMAHHAGAKVLVDGAQSVSHMRVDVRALDADWFVFSGHKVFAPTGIGVLYGKEALLNETQPWQGGGNMIEDVTFEHIKYHNAPGRFEAGTGNIADAVGLGAAIDYVTRIGIDLISRYEHYLLVYATGLLKEVPGLRLIGTAPNKASVLSFVLEGFRTEEVGAALNQEGIAVRSGHHCAQPILRRFGLEATVRPSLAFYNTCSDIDTLVSTLHRLRSGHKHALRK
jgi:cysteine desulfurase/selenocysteine lyase